MNNRTIIMAAMVVAVVMMMGTASAATNHSHTNATISDWDEDVVIANGTHNLTIGFNTTNATVVNASNWAWCINITNPTVGDWQWVSISVWNGTDWQSVNGNNTTFLANQSNKANTTGWTYGIPNGTNYTAVISLNTTNSTVHLGGFDVNITNSGNASEWAKLSELNFTAGPVNATQSEIVNESVSAVANSTDKMPMRLALRDTNGNPVLSLSTGPTITAVNLNGTNAAGDVVESSFVINQTTGNVTFNITATEAGVYNVSAVCDGVTITNLTTVFIAGPAYQLAWYGDTSSEPGGNSITQCVAIQDANGNNVTWDTLNAETLPYRLTATKLTGHPIVVSSNPVFVTAANATNVTGASVRYTSTFELINFTYNNTYDEITTIQVRSNRTMLAAETSLTYYGAVDHLEVTTDKQSMYANGSDSMLVTVQLKDENDVNVDSDGVTVTVGAANPTLFGGLAVIGDDATPVGATLGVNTTVNGVATFTVTSTTLSGSEAIDASITDGQSGVSQTITLMPAPKIANCDVETTVAIIKAGGTSVITATIKDYNDEVMSGRAVTFNITSGDGTFVGESSPYTTNTVSNGNATVSVTSTNVSTTIKVNVTIVDENTVTQQIGSYEHSFEVDPAAITTLVIDPVSKGLKNEKGTDATFNVTTTDDYGNLNITVLNLNVTNSNQVLGNLSLFDSATHVNNNLSLTTSGGYVRFNFTVNSTVAASATLNVTANTLYNAGNLATNLSKTALVTTSGPTGVVVSFNTTTPAVGDTVQAYAQLIDPDDNPLGIEGTVMTFTVKKGSTTVAMSVNNTNETGMATYNMTVSEFGTYTVTASNSTLIASGSITFSGPIVSIVATANGTTSTHSTPINSTVTVNATAMDSAGNVATGESGVVWFTVDDVNIGADTDSGVGSGSVIFVNGVASITYTESTAGTYTVLAWYNETVSDTVDVTFTTETTPSLSVTAAPTSVTANTSTDVTFTVTSEGTAVSGTPVVGATVTLSGAGVSESGTTVAGGTVTIAVNATGAGTITVTATKTGYADATVTVTAVSESGRVCGDVDTNVGLDARDVSYLAKHVAEITGYETLHGDGDVDTNEGLDARDVSYLAKHVAEITGYETLNC